TAPCAGDRLSPTPFVHTCENGLATNWPDRARQQKHPAVDRVRTCPPKRIESEIDRAILAFREGALEAVPRRCDRGSRCRRPSRNCFQGTERRRPRCEHELPDGAPRPY